jgi:hypothetical protein
MVCEIHSAIVLKPDHRLGFGIVPFVETTHHNNVQVAIVVDIRSPC